MIILQCLIFFPGNDMVELEADLGRMDKVEAETDDISDALQVARVVETSICHCLFVSLFLPSLFLPIPFVFNYS